MTAIILTLMTGFVWNLVGIIFGGADRKPQRLFCFFFEYSVVFIVFAAAAGLLFGDLHFAVSGTGMKEFKLLAGLVFPIGLLSMVNFYTLKRAMETGSQSIAWGVAQFSCVIPFCASIAFLGVIPSCRNTVGIVMMISSLVLFSWSMAKKNPDRKDRKSSSAFFRFSLLSFCGTGIGQTLYMLPNSRMFELSAEILKFRVLLLALPGILWIVPVLLSHASAEDFCAVWKRALLYGIVVAVGQILFFSAIDAMDATGKIGFAAPLAIGSCVLLFFLYRILSGKERASVPVYCGMFAGIVGILLMAR